MTSGHQAGIMEIGDVFVITRLIVTAVLTTEKELEALLSLLRATIPGTPDRQDGSHRKQGNTGS